MKVIINTLFFWLFAIGSYHFASSQTFYKTFDSIESNNSDYIVQEKLDSLLLNTKEHTSYEAMAHDFSVKYYIKDDFEAAIKYALLEVQSFEKHHIQNKKYTKALYQLASFYEYNSEINQAIKYYKKVISTDPNSIKAINSYSLLGDCYFLFGNYFQAETYYLKSISELENSNDFTLLALHHLDLSKVYHNIETVESRNKELEILNKVLDIHDKHPLSERSLSILYNNLANYYNDKNNYDFIKAKFYYQKLIINSIKNSDSSVIGAGYVNMGNLYIQEERDSSRYYLEKSLYYPLSNNTKSRVFRNIANYEILKNNNNAALKSLDKAISINLLDHKTEFNNPNLTQFKNATDYIEIISILSKKADILLKKYDKDREKTIINDAFKNLQTADSLIDYIKSSNKEENSRLYWRKEASEIYHKAVYCSYLLNDNELAFTYSEKNKAILLTENIIQNSFKLPQSVNNRKKTLELKLLDYEEKIKNNTDSASIKFYSKAILDQKLEIKNYNDSIAIEYPTLFNKANDSPIISLNEVQEKLSPEELIISYVWNDKVEYKDHLMCLVISPDDVQIFEIKNAQALNKDITLMNQMLLKPFETSKKKNAYNIQANKIYNTLFPKQDLKEKLKGKKITIVADGQLQNIPFDALITDIDKNTYLIEESQISYTYSLSFSKSNRAVERNTQKDLICFSPTNFDSLDLPKLYNTNQEINNINKFITGDNYTNNLATKTAFKKEIDNYKIIHLATHASSGDDPFIAFHDDKVSIKELYTLKNNAHLVFLSACDTSVGEIAQGEGTLTLARGFFNTGAQSVIASLWKTSDKSTSYIVEEFYKNIEKEKGVATALHLAKLKYIKEHNLSDVSPFYWSSLIAIGDDDIIKLEQSNSYQWLIYTLLFFLCAIIIIWIYKHFLQSKTA